MMLVKSLAAGRQPCSSGASWRRLPAALILAITLGSRAHAQTPDSKQQVQQHLLRAEHALQAGHTDQAEHEFGEIVKIDPGNFEARANVGVFRYLRGDWVGAID
jgi:Tfp pilus assembly protein PilF